MTTKVQTWLKITENSTNLTWKKTFSPVMTHRAFIWVSRVVSIWYDKDYLSLSCLDQQERTKATNTLKFVSTRPHCMCVWFLLHLRMFYDSFLYKFQSYACQKTLLLSYSPFFSGVFVRIKDKNLHVECFKCSTCGSNLKNQGYYNLNNKLYCDIHARLAALSSPPPNSNGMVPVTVPPYVSLYFYIIITFFRNPCPL